MKYRDWPSFDELMKMAKDSPEALEAFREREVETLIANAPKEMRKRLRGLQFQVDCQRQLHKKPLGACVAVSKMMRDSLKELNRALNEGVSNDANNDIDDVRQDNIVPFAS